MDYESAIKSWFFRWKKKFWIFFWKIFFWVGPANPGLRWVLKLQNGALSRLYVKLRVFIRLSSYFGKMRRMDRRNFPENLSPIGWTVKKLWSKWNWKISKKNTFFQEFVFWTFFGTLLISVFLMVFGCRFFCFRVKFSVDYESAIKSDHFWRKSVKKSVFLKKKFWNFFFKIFFFSNFFFRKI